MPQSSSSFGRRTFLGGLALAASGCARPPEQRAVDSPVVPSGSSLLGQERFKTVVVGLADTQLDHVLLARAQTAWGTARMELARQRQQRFLCEETIETHRLPVGAAEFAPYSSGSIEQFATRPLETVRRYLRTGSDPSVKHLAFVVVPERLGGPGLVLDGAAHEDGSLAVVFATPALMTSAHWATSLNEPLSGVALATHEALHLLGEVHDDSNPTNVMRTSVGLGFESGYQITLGPSQISRWLGAPESVEAAIVASRDHLDAIGHGIGRPVTGLYPHSAGASQIWTLECENGVLALSGENTYVISGAAHDVWTRQGGRDELGPPIGPPQSDSNGRPVQPCARGTLALSAGIGIGY